MSLEQKLTEEQKADILNEVERSRRKQAIVQLFEKGINHPDAYIFHQTTLMLPTLTSLDFASYLRLVKKAWQLSKNFFSDDKIVFEGLQLLLGIGEAEARTLLESDQGNPEGLQAFQDMYSATSRTFDGDLYWQEHRDELPSENPIDLNFETFQFLTAVDCGLDPDAYSQNLTEAHIAAAFTAVKKEFYRDDNSSREYDLAQSLLLLVYSAKCPSLQAIHDDAYAFCQEFLNKPVMQDTKGIDTIITGLQRIVQQEQFNYAKGQLALELSEASSVEELFDCLAMQSDDYIAVQGLGSGKGGTTYKAYSPVLKQHRAIKVISPNNVNSKEAELLAGIERRDLENIVQIHQAGAGIVRIQGEERYAIVMEYVDGKTLDEINKSHPLEPAQVLYLTVQILHGIRRLRAYGITHRDLNMKNIKLTSKGTIKILDFGIATDELKPAPMDARRFGVPTSFEEANDLFSFGLLVYQLATREHFVVKKEQMIGSETHAHAVARLKERMYVEGVLRGIYKKKIRKKLLEGDILRTEDRPGAVEMLDIVQRYYPGRNALVYRLRRKSWAHWREHRQRRKMESDKAPHLVKIFGSPPAPFSDALTVPNRHYHLKSYLLGTEEQCLGLGKIVLHCLQGKVLESSLVRIYEKQGFGHYLMSREDLLVKVQYLEEITKPLRERLN